MLISAKVMRLAVLGGYTAFLWLWQGEMLTFVLTLPMFLIVLVGMARINSEWLTVADVIWITAWLFFVVEPLQNISNGVYISGPARAILFSNGDYVRGMAVPVLFFGFALLTSCLGRNRMGLVRRIKSFRVPAERLPILIIIFYIFAILTMMALGGPQNILRPRRELDQTGAANTMNFSVIFLAITFNMAYLTLLSLKRCWSIRSPEFWAVFATIFIPLIILQNPINAPRYYLIGLFTPIILIMANGRIGISLAYGGIAFLLFVGMPVLSSTTRTGGIDSTFSETRAGSIGFIDGYEELVWGVRKIDYEGHTFGARTVGTALFFVPRSVWKGKPEIFGLEVGRDLLFFDRGSTSNLSMFFGADIYSDFGYIGVAVFGMAITCALLYFGVRTACFINGVEMRHALFLSAIPILIRGPIGANIGLFVCQMAALTCLSLAFARSDRFKSLQRAPLLFRSKMHFPAPSSEQHL